SEVADTALRAGVDDHVDRDAVEPRLGDDELAEALASLDHDLVAAVAALLRGVRYGDFALVEVEHDSLILQRIETEDAVGALPDMLPFHERRLADVEAAAAEREVIDGSGFDLLPAGHADQGRRLAVVDLQPVGQAARQYRRLSARVDEERERPLAPDRDRDGHALVRVVIDREHFHAGVGARILGQGGAGQPQAERGGEGGNRVPAHASLSPRRNATARREGQDTTGAVEV